MDSPSFQSPNHPSRFRSHSIALSRTATGSSSNSSNTNHAAAAVDSRGAIQKRSNINDRHRSISVSQADRLYRLAAEQSSSSRIDCRPTSVPDPSLGLQLQWITPQQSPQPQGFSEPALETFRQQWTVPTPPRSDSGIPNVSLDSTSDESAACISTSSGFDHFDQPATASEEMSSLGFLLPSQYGGPAPYESDQQGNYASMDQNYIPPMRMSQPASTTGSAAYAPTTSSSPALYQHSRQPETARRYPDSTSAYDQSYHRSSSNPYDARPSSNYSVVSGQTIPPISGITQSPPMPQYSNSQLPPRAHSLYEQNSMYGQPAYTASPSASQMYGTTSAPAYPGPAYGSASSASAHGMPQRAPSNATAAAAAAAAADNSIRVLNQRPKPQCFDHGCNGRQFSTFSNLLRHQREKSGTAAKSYCPKCGAEFTRTTARNGHLAHDKCTKQRRPSLDGK